MTLNDYKEELKLEVAKDELDYFKISDLTYKIAVLSGKKDDFIAIEQAIKSISSMTINKDSAISQMANLFNKPLKVEFSDKTVAIATNITLEIDGEKFLRKTVNQKALVQILKNT